MKKTSITLFSLLILFTFIGTLTFFGVSIKNEIASSNERNNGIFNTIVRGVESNLERIAEIDFSSGNDSINSFSIRHNNELITCYPNEEIADGANSTNLIKIFNKTIVQGEDVYSIKVSLYILRPSVIYSTTKKAFIIILCATVLTIFVLIYVSKTENNAGNEEDFTDEAEEEIFEEEVKEEDFGGEEDSETPQEESEENNSQPVPEEHSETEEAEIQEETTESESDSEAFSIFDIESENEEPELSKQEVPEESPYYQGLQENVISTEKEAFINKLNAAISKASSEENDLSLYLFQVSEPCDEQKIKNLLGEYFFENDVEKIDQDIFAAFKANQNVDEAEDYACKIQSQISLNSENKNCFVGISSKSIRMLGADRLLMEAEEALCHAKDDPTSPIIGFHVDIEKYREFIKNS